MCSVAFSQAISLSGTVSNAKGKPVAGAQVTLINQQITVATDSAGSFTIIAEAAATALAAHHGATGNVAISNGVVSLRLATPTPVSLEQFDIHGRLLKRLDTKTLPPGEYRFDDFHVRNASAMTTLRISTNTMRRTVQLLSFGNKTLCGPGTVVAAGGVRPSGVRSSVIRPVIDHLKITAPGYISTLLPLMKYQNPPYTVTLDTLRYGIFKIRLFAADSTTDMVAFTSIEGVVYDGPSPPDIIFGKIEESGPCVLYKTKVPFCALACGPNGKCVAQDSCQRYPAMLDAGPVTVSGLRFNGVATRVTMNASGNNFYQLVGNQPDYPPFGEGDTIRLTTEGTAAVAPVFIYTRGISPLVVPDEKIVLEDGKPVTFKWQKPALAGISTMHIRINLSYHGGTKGEILVDCDDNGEVTVPAAMIDKLKSLGIAGWPIADLTRRSIATQDSTHSRIVIESTVTRDLVVPGVISCNDDESCAPGRCVDRMCR
jgi:hypothetical protein